MSGEDIVLRWRFPPPQEGRDLRTFDILLDLGGDMEPLHLYKVSLHHVAPNVDKADFL